MLSTHQSNFFIPGEAGYSPHWNVNSVHTTAGKTMDDIFTLVYLSDHSPQALFDDAQDIVGYQSASIVTIDHPGVVMS